MLFKLVKGMKEFNIIATIPAKKTDIEYIDNIIDQGINSFRFNFSKFDQNIEKRIIAISKIKEIYGDSISVLVDIPYPKKKVRLYHNNEYFNIDKGQLFTVSSSQTSDKVFITDIENIGDLVHENDELVYCDNDAILVVKEIINSNTIILEAKNPFYFRNGKSISITYQDNKKFSISLYQEIIDIIHPRQIALSFVENKSQIADFKKLIKLPSKLEIFSKIETQTGIDKINSICDMSNIIIGRGDLCIYSDLNNLYYNQKKIVDSSKKHKRKCYIATGILNSLLNHYEPTQSDIIDLSYILALNPNGIILNSAVIIENVDTVIRTIKKIKYNIENSEVYNND